MSQSRNVPHLVLGLMLSALVSSLGCSGGDAGGEGAAGAKAGDKAAVADGASAKSAASSEKHETPEAVFEAAKKAMEAENYPNLVACFTPESQEVMVFGMTMAGTMAKAFAGMGEAFGAEPDADAKAEIEAKFAPLDKVLEKYGLTEDALGDDQMQAMQDPQAAIKKISGMVKDKSAFIGEMMKALDAVSDGKSQGPQQMFQAKLSDMKIEGDSATAQATSPERPERPRPLHFQKIDGGWYIDLSKEFAEDVPVEVGDDEAAE